MLARSRSPKMPCIHLLVIFLALTSPAAWKASRPHCPQLRRPPNLPVYCYDLLGQEDTTPRQEILHFPFQTATRLTNVLLRCNSRRSTAVCTALFFICPKTDPLGKTVWWRHSVDDIDCRTIKDGGDSHFPEQLPL